MKKIFVDGYNVINSWPELKRTKEYNFDTARTELIEKLSNYAAYKGYKIFLVFDAHMVKGSIQKKEKITGNLVIIFTKEGETADNFIERKVNEIGRKAEVCVVTSDSIEQQVVFQRGATRMSSMEFYYEVKTIDDKIKVKIEKKYSEKRHVLEDMLQQNILEKLEEIRRSQ